MEKNELFDLLKQYIEDSKATDVVNLEDHKTINKCLTEIKVQLKGFESYATNSDGIRATCFQKQNDMELRVREVEKQSALLADVPVDLKKMIKQVYWTGGIVSAIVAIAVTTISVLIKHVG